MKIVIVNYRFFVSGGPERYMFNIMDMLEKNGHTVIPFSVKHNRNKQTAYDNYFLKPIGDGNAVSSKEYDKWNFDTLRKSLSRMLYSFEARSQFKKLLIETKPDIIYLLYYQNKISASVIDVAYNLKIPVVQRISDFGYICANSIFYRYQKKQVCEKCLHHTRLNAIIHKCVEDSYIKSFIKTLSLKIIDARSTREKISSFVVPSKFTISKLSLFGMPVNKIHHIPTFFNDNQIQNDEVFEDFFLYVGRVTESKGIITLLNAFVNTSYKLLIIGGFTEEYGQLLQNHLSGKKHNIQFLGEQDFSTIKEYLRTCLCTICPSEWYENFPNSVLESFAFNKPVIAANIGSLREPVIHKTTGLLYKAADDKELRSAVEYMLENKDEVIEMGKKAKQKLTSDYSASGHYSRLINLFSSVIDSHSSKN